MQGYKENAIKGVSWSFIDNIANYDITFLVGIILARILLPSEFGIIGMITIFITGFNSIIDNEFSITLIPNVGEKKIWTIFN